MIDITPRPVCAVLVSSAPMQGSWLVLVLAQAVSDWRPVGPGADHLLVSDRGAQVHLLRFQLARYRPGVIVLPAGGPRTAAAVRGQGDVVAAVNGGFFDTDWRPLGLRVAAGRTLLGLRPRVDWGVLVVRGAHAEIVHSRAYRPDSAIDTALQVGPRLLVDGHPVKLKPQSARRTAVALERDGLSLTLAVVNERVEAQQLAALLARLGFTTALMLDGGPSTQLSAALDGWKLDVPGGYAVPDLLVIRPR